MLSPKNEKSLNFLSNRIMKNETIKHKFIEHEVTLWNTGIILPQKIKIWKYIYL